jgi:hypothetical protein
MSLYENINRRKKLGISRPKSKTTISTKAYAKMKKGFKKGGKVGTKKR